MRVVNDDLAVFCGFGPEDVVKWDRARCLVICSLSMAGYAPYETCFSLLPPREMPQQPAPLLSRSSSAACQRARFDVSSSRLYVPSTIKASVPSVSEAFLPTASVAGTSARAVFVALPSMDGSRKGSIASSPTPSAMFTMKECMCKSAWRRQQRKEGQSRVSTAQSPWPVKRGRAGRDNLASIFHKRVRQWASVEPRLFRETTPTSIMSHLIIHCSQPVPTGSWRRPVDQLTILICV